MRGGNFKDVVNCLLLVRSQDKQAHSCWYVHCSVKEWTRLWRIVRPASPFVLILVTRSLCYFFNIKDHSKSLSIIVNHHPYNNGSFLFTETCVIRNATTAGDLFCAPIVLQVSLEPANFWHPAPTPLTVLNGVKLQLFPLSFLAEMERVRECVLEKGRGVHTDY